jgi:hypothetical protein
MQMLKLSTVQSDNKRGIYKKDTIPRADYRTKPEVTREPSTVPSPRLPEYQVPYQATGYRGRSQRLPRPKPENNTNYLLLQSILRLEGPVYYHKILSVEV